MITATSQPRADTGSAMYELIAELMPICRGKTGDGVRDTLQRLRLRVPVEVYEVPSGTPVYDWIVPDEWNVRDAWIADENGQRVVDFADSNLHVVNGSAAVSGRYSWSKLREHLHSLPDHPQWIPFRTCEAGADWGFCISHQTLRELDALGEREYEVLIDARVAPGHLTYGELFLPGESDREVLISTHVCHPALANDGLSGIAVATGLARSLMDAPRRLSYRFLFVPATIGAITWLALNERETRNVEHGLVLSCVGDPGPFTYHRSRRGDATIDRATAHVLKNLDWAHVLDFEPRGYDQRQFCSPGFDLPVGGLMRTPNGAYPEYHTSADDLNLVTPTGLAESLDVCRRIVDVLEHDRVLLNTKPMCEPRLGPSGLYASFGSGPDAAPRQEAVLWVLNLSDGSHSLLDVAERSGLDFAVVLDAADALLEHGFLEEDLTSATFTDDAQPALVSRTPAIPEDSLS